MSTVHHRHAGPEKYSCNFRVLSDRLLADDRMTPATKLVLMAIQNFGFGKDHCHPSVETIAKATCLSKNKVRDSLKLLADLGLIRVDPDPTNRTGKRIVRLWMSDPDLHPIKVAERTLGPESEPKGALGSENGADLGFKKSSRSLGSKNGPERTLPRERGERTMKMIGSSSSSSQAPHSGEGEKSLEDDVESFEHDGTSNWCVDHAKVLFTHFEDVPSIPKRVVKLCREYGSEAVAEALIRATSVIRNGGMVNWRFVEKVAENQHKEGGAIGISINVNELNYAEQKKREEIDAKRKAHGW